MNAYEFSLVIDPRDSSINKQIIIGNDLFSAMSDYLDNITTYIYPKTNQLRFMSYRDMMLDYYPLDADELYTIYNTYNDFITLYKNTLKLYYTDINPNPNINMNINELNNLLSKYENEMSIIKKHTNIQNIDMYMYTLSIVLIELDMGKNVLHELHNDMIYLNNTGMTNIFTNIDIK